jgi:hypothetical protein
MASQTGETSPQAPPPPLVRPQMTLGQGESRQAVNLQASRIPSMVESIGGAESLSSSLSQQQLGDQVWERSSSAEVGEVIGGSSDGENQLEAPEESGDDPVGFDAPDAYSEDLGLGNVADDDDDEGLSAYVLPDNDGMDDEDAEEISDRSGSVF